MKIIFHQGFYITFLASNESIALFFCFVSFFSYPYSEELHEARSYSRARCPAWCDRILLSHSFKDFIDNQVKIYRIYSFVHSVLFRPNNQHMILWVTMYL